MKRSAFRNAWLGRHTPSRRWIIALSAAWAVGCAPAPRDFFTPATQHLVWPPPPERPRVRYLGEISSPLPVGARGTAARLHSLLHGPEAPVHLVTPYAVAVDHTGDRLAVADTNAGCVHLLDLANTRYVRIDHIGEGGEALRCPVGVAWAGSRWCVADSMLPAVFVIDLDGGGARRWTIEGLQRPAGVAYDAGANRFYVTDGVAHCVFVLDGEGKLLRTIGGRGNEVGRFNFPSHAAVGADGSLYVADSLNVRVQRFSAEGEPLAAFGRKGDAAGDLSLPKGVAVDPDGNVWVVDAHFENVQAFTPDGKLLLALGGEGRGPGQFWLPAGACIDSRRRLWIADSYNRRVQVFQLLTATEP